MFFWYFLNEWVSNDGERIIPKAWFSRHTKNHSNNTGKSLRDEFEMSAKNLLQIPENCARGSWKRQKKNLQICFPLIFVLKKIKFDKSNFHEQFVLNLGELDFIWITIIYALLLVCFWWRNTLVNSCVPTVDGWKAASE